jgi:hypothetical protein
MTNWEYKTENLCIAALAMGELKRNTLVAILNRIGRQGWEFVCFLDKSYSNFEEDSESAMDPGFGLFRRAVEDQVAPSEDNQKP